jgi:5-methylcytosine-specific restriction endonuclease McrA
MKKVLLLNLSEEVLGVISWMDAVRKIVRGVARKPYGHEETYEIRTSAGVFELPTAIVLVEYKHIPYKNAPLTAENLLKRDNNECQYCGKSLSRKTLTMDHVVPESRGGKRTWKNIVASCKTCNNGKDNRTPKEANMALKKEPRVPTRSILVFMVSESKNRKSWHRWLDHTTVSV